ncbi:MAG: DUF4097 domain-containing protein [Thermoanaerobaculia bacterium]|nr:DUF4097 domain-containing protein [Thermoanaerobaculia bacterium]
MQRHKPESVLRSQRRSTFLASIALLAFGFAGANAVLAEQTKTVEKSFSTDRAVTIVNIGGSFEVVPATGNSVKVRATVHAEGRNDAETRSLLDSMVWVQHRGQWGLSYPTDDYSGFAYPQQNGRNYSSSKYFNEPVKVYGKTKRGVPVLYADLVVEMPAGAELTVDGVVGPMTTRGRLQGELTLDTGSGKVSVESFDGKLLVDTGSGDVEVRDVYGSLSVDTGSGDVEVHGLEVSDLLVDTGSGDVWIANGSAESARIDTGSGQVTGEDFSVVDLDVDTGSGDVTLVGDLSRARSLRFDTGSGDVRIEGGSAFEFDLAADLGSGRVYVEYADADLRYDGREVVGARRGSGGTRVLVDTGSGDCTLR